MGCVKAPPFKKGDNMDKLKAEQFLGIVNKTADTSASEGETPFAHHKDGGMEVIGNANEIDTKKNDYIIEFRAPADFFGDNRPEGSKVVGNSVLFTKHVYDQFIPAIKETKMLAAISGFLQFHKDIEEHKGENRPPEELLQIFAAYEPEIHIALFDAVAIFLDVPDTIKYFMRTSNVLENYGKLFENHPELFDEAESFFTSSSSALRTETKA